jgi:hypothetical protein
MNRMYKFSVRQLLREMERRSFMQNAGLGIAGTFDNWWVSLAAPDGNMIHLAQKHTATTPY